MIFLWFVIIIIVSYFIGNINFARILAWKRKKQDITTKGSFNPGTINMLRVYGLKIAISTLTLECIKGGIPALISGLIINHFYPGMFYVAFLTAGLSAVIGQIFPVIYNFRGGKGLATCAGVFFFSPLWWVGVIMFILAFLELYYTDIASVATLSFIGMMGVATTIYITLFKTTKLYWIIPFTKMNPYWWIALILLWLMIAIIFIAHRKNLYRLFRNQENKIDFKNKIREFLNKKEGYAELNTIKETDCEEEIIIKDDK